MDDIDPDFFEDTKPLDVSEENLSALSRLATTLETLEAELAENTRKAEQIKAQIERLETDLIPAAMDKIGMADFRLTNGAKVVVQPITRASIPAARKQEAFAWLRAHNAGTLIKQEITLSFGKGQDKKAHQTLQILKDLGLDPENKENVAWNTLTAWVKEQLASGANLPKDVLGIWVGRKAKIEK
jgi:hypothetical protein